ncbi:prolipoprotein diacylglyceryl transferase [bacterium]|nr:prolipoprotein diacylglyceryl transferase [bacterium]
MNERIETMDTFIDTELPRVKAREIKSDFGPVVLYQGESFTFVSFGLIVGLGALMASLHTWFYLGSYHILSPIVHANQLALSLALGGPLSAYIITRLLDIKTWLSGEKSFIEYIRTVSFGLWGGLVGGMLIVTTFATITQTPLLALLDAFAVGFPLAQMLGRLGCLNYGCCHGNECSSDHQFGIRYFNAQTKVLRYDPKLKGKRLHPTQIYSALANFAIYLTMLTLWLVWDARAGGALAATFMVLYGLKRFMVELLRGEFPRVYLYGLTLWQWFSLSFIVLGLGTAVFVILFGQANQPGDFGSGFESMQSGLGILAGASLIMGLVYGTHGKKIGQW